jgi:putative acetyltransferase
MEIVVDDLSSASVIDFLRQHRDNMVLISPPHSVHALDLDGLRASAVTLWTAWDNDELLGCGALQELDARHGEIKAMRTAAAHLRRGVATAVLQYLIDVSRLRGYTRLSLETGSGPAFEPADALYKKFGFEYCGPFSNYRDDPFSRFMSLKL